MEEKKLTDEEIVKAYEYCVIQHRDCDGCPYDGWGCPIKGRDVVEAFYRLQNENEKQKAEIERLTKLAELRLRDNQDTCKLLAEKEKQVDELTAFKNEAISMSLYGKGRKDGEEVAVKDTAKEILEKVKSYTLDKEVGMRYLIKRLGEEYGVE